MIVQWENIIQLKLNKMKDNKNELDWTKKDQKDWEKFKKNLPNLLEGS